MAGTFILPVLWKPFRRTAQMGAFAENCIETTCLTNYPDPLALHKFLTYADHAILIRLTRRVIFKGTDFKGGGRLKKHPWKQKPETAGDGNADGGKKSTPAKPAE